MFKVTNCDLEQKINDFNGIASLSLAMTRRPRAVRHCEEE